MASKANFTQGQWLKVLQSPLLAGFAVSAADPSGLIGTLQEGMASAKALAAAKADAGSDELIRCVVDDLLTAEGRTAARDSVRELIRNTEIGQIKIKALEELRNVAKILDSATPVESRPFKNWLTQVAVAVAEAASEGGLLGFGGEKVSDAERATLAEIKAALGL